MSDNLLAETLFTEELYKVSPKTVIVITTPWPDLKKEERDQLLKITEALRQRIDASLGLHAFRMVYVEALELSDWSERPSKLIYFGQGIKGLSPYELIQAGSTKMVLSEPLADLIPREAARAKLWLALQQLFGGL